MKRWLMAWGCLLLCGAALAAGPRAVRKRVEASMLLAGSLVVAPDGSVSSYQIDKADTLPAAVRDLVRKSVASWRFEPVRRRGAAVTATARMSLRVVARPTDASHYSLTVGGTYFGDDAMREDRQAALRADPAVRMAAPLYPQDAIHARVSGTVYLLLRADRHGRVEDAFAEQVNLDEVASDAAMAHWRRVLAQASLRAARHWTLPTRGQSVDHWLVRVPVRYNLRGWGMPRGDRYGQWQTYIPGPRELPPWAGELARGSASADALPDTGVYGVSQPLHLLTPLDRG